jgi:hypothetical protein
MKANTQQGLDFTKADLLNCDRILDDKLIAFHSQQAI